MVTDCLYDLIDDGFNVDFENFNDDYPEIALTKYGKSFNMGDICQYIIDLNSHLQGNFNLEISRVLYREEVSYGMEDSMKSPQELDDRWRYTDIENIGKVNSNKIYRVEILLIEIDK
jgi:hypothetical protein